MKIVAIFTETVQTYCGGSSRRRVLIPRSERAAYGSAVMPDRNAPLRTYERTWEEIEAMLEKAEMRIVQWRKWFDECELDGDRQGMKDAARNYKALEGVVKTLKWTLGEQGIDSPLS